MGISLSGFEERVLRLVSSALDNKEISALLSMSESDVRGHICRMKEKLGAHDRFELAICGLGRRGFFCAGRRAGRKREGSIGRRSPWYGATRSPGGSQ